MAYNGVNWVNDGPPAINATNLEIMDNGIAEADANATAANDKINSMLSMDLSAVDTVDGKYATFSGGVVKFSNLSGNSYKKFEIDSKDIGFLISVTRISGAYNMFYIIANASNQVLDYFNDSSVTSISKYIDNITNAKYLYVNYDTAQNNVNVKVYKNISFVNDIEAEIEGKISTTEIKEIPKQTTYNNIYVSAGSSGNITTTTVSGNYSNTYNVANYAGKKVKISSNLIDASHPTLCIVSNGTKSVLKVENAGVITYTDYEVELPSDASVLYVNYVSGIKVELIDILYLADVKEELDNSSLNARLQGKKCVCFGDSITWYDGQTYNWGKEQGQVCKGYESYLREAGMDVNNQGYSGASIRLIVDNRILPFDFTGYDYVTVTSGANDSRKGIPVGEIAETGSTFDNTFIGRLQAGIEHILDSNPEIKILLITPIRGWIYTPAGYDRPTPPETDGVVEKVYADAIKAVAEYYAIPICDWYNDCGCNIFTREWYINDPEPDKTADPNPNILYSLHPSSKGYKRMADLLLPVIRNI